MSNFERKYGKYAIRNLSTMLILCYAVGYVIQLINPEFLSFLTLNPNEILHGQIWRFFTWVVVPPSMGNIFTTLIMLYFYWSIGTTLERTWGAYRYNVYIFSGLLFTILGSFVAMGLGYIIYGPTLAIIPGGLDYLLAIGSLSFSTAYVNMSIFLAFAATFPDSQVYLLFIVPIKVKWMGLVYGVLIIWEFIDGTMFTKIAIAFSLLNFVVFFFTSRKLLMRSPKQIKRQHMYKREVNRNSNEITKHKCAVCGRTDETNPELEFRFCSKCNGNYEYCQDHLFTHTHIL